MNILNVGYDSTNYYLLEIKNGKLLVDCGWPGTLPKFLAVLKRKDVSPGEIKYLLVTHFHPDHAGLAQELKNLGVSLILPESQEGYITAMDELYKSKKLPYLPVTPEKNILLKFADSRKFLAGLGLQGEILPTPGHSQDGVTLILDEGFAFTGDLAQRFMLPETDLVSRQSWDRINQYKITRIFPGHGG
jgi:glyoxylase-like metal-dependent hydrolase (beta-lactamase superfamily II)